MSRATIRVFEHERLKVGESLRTTDGSKRSLTQAEFERLVRFDDSRRDRIFEVGHKSLRFRHYVGFLQVGDLGIEILPKVDRTHTGQAGRAHWHDILLRMLRVARKLPTRSPTSANLSQSQGSLLDVFVELFLTEVARLTHQGLARSYRLEQANMRSLGGRLLIREQLRHNLVHQERFYVERSVHDTENLPNQILHAALRALSSAALPNALESRRRSLLTCFESLPRPTISIQDIDRLRLGRKTERYRLALDLARLILLGHSPRLRTGDVELLALLFDMNALWESYVATTLARAAGPTFEIRTQERLAFWHAPSRTRVLRPDIVVRQRGQDTPIAVIDTKWKVPKNGQPSSGDLKQMFAYNELLGSKRAILLYPTESQESQGPAGHYAVGDHGCEIWFLSATDSLLGDRCCALLAMQNAPNSHAIGTDA